MNGDVRLAAYAPADGVLRFGLVRWEGDRMLPDHGPAADYQMPWP